ncbi:hypothetical protein [Actinomadura fibrosa]|uniref:Secreted protein n=1 Tax=Actinomadura fibrosa TaxID=111802 RepID=A0ABW2XDW2_9ACTN|nr:hypothetical protein [Actinomadura fibrosa]
MRWWKALGIAGFVGVAATGAVIARAERRRRAYTPDQIRERLHARLDEQPDEQLDEQAGGQPDEQPGGPAGTAPGERA